MQTFRRAVKAITIRKSKSTFTRETKWVKGNYGRQVGCSSEQNLHEQLLLLLQ